MIRVAEVSSQEGHEIAPWLGATLRAGDGLALAAGVIPGWLHVLRDGDEPVLLGDGLALAEVRAKPRSMLGNALDHAQSSPGAALTADDALPTEFPIPGAHVMALTTKRGPAHLAPKHEGVADELVLVRDGVRAVMQGVPYILPRTSLAYAVVHGEDGHDPQVLVPLDRLRALVLADVEAA